MDVVEHERPFLFPWFVMVLLAAIWLPGWARAEKLDETTLFSVVNGEAIPMQRYVDAFQRGLRTRFYHGKPPENELNEYRKEIGFSLIDTVLLEQEARRLGLRPDREWVEQRLARQLKRLRKDPRWQEEKGVEVEASLRAALERESLLQQLISRIQEVAPPTEAQLEAYYRKHPDKFSNPGKTRAGVILFKVPPYADSAAWQAARKKAESIRERILKGEDFAELAKQYSDDPSASRGGDLGYLHKGMLGETAEKELSKLQPGEVSEPVALLEGFALLRLAERQPARLNRLSKVRDRAIQLWQRERREQALQEELEKLRRQAKVEILDQGYLSVPGVREAVSSRGWSPARRTEGQ